METETWQERLKVKADNFIARLRTFWHEHFGELTLTPVSTRNIVLSGLLTGLVCGWFQTYAIAAAITSVALYFKSRPAVFLIPVLAGLLRAESAHVPARQVSSANADFLVELKGLPERVSDAYWIEGEVTECTYPEPVSAPIQPGDRIRIELAFPRSGKLLPYPSQWVRGDRIEFRGKIRPLYPRYNPGSFDRDLYLQRNGFAARVETETGNFQSHAGSTGFTASLDRFRLDTGRLFSGTGSGGKLMSAMVLGLREDVDPSTTQDMNRIGLAHLLSISGVHFTLFAIWLILIIELLLGCIPAIPLRFPLRRIAVVAAVPILAVYTLLTGAQIGTVRALIMFSLAAVALATGRRAVAFDALILAGAGMLLLEPSLVENISFQLSFLSMLGIACLPGSFDPASSAISLAGGSAIVSLAATLLTAPLTVNLFHQVALSGLVANTLLLPVIEGMFLPAGLLGAALAALRIPSLDGPFLVIWQPLTRSLEQVLSTAGRWLPGPAQTGAPSAFVCGVYFVLIALGFHALWNRKVPAFLIGSCTAILVLLFAGRGNSPDSQLIVTDSGFHANIIWFQPGSRPVWIYAGSQPPFRSTIRMIDGVLAHQGVFGDVDIYPLAAGGTISDFAYAGRSFHGLSAADLNSRGVSGLISGDAAALVLNAPSGPVVIDSGDSRWKSGTSRSLGPVGAWICTKKECRPPREVSKSSATIVWAIPNRYRSSKNIIATNDRGQIRLDLSGTNVRISAARLDVAYQASSGSSPVSRLTVP